jgi:hypothetical protein
MLGAGELGGRWIREIRQPIRDRMEFAGLVDLNPAALHEAGDWLGLQHWRNCSIRWRIMRSEAG